MFDYSMLRGRIVEKFGTIGKFADAVGRTQTSLSMVLNGERYLKQNDIDLWASTLGIDPTDIGVFFYTKKVHET